jgi:hypothetical protein
MSETIAEIAGIFLILIGFGAIVAAAALISVALAVLAAGVLTTFAGVVVVYVANVRSSRVEKPQP